MRWSIDQRICSIIWFKVTNNFFYQSKNGGSFKGNTKVRSCGGFRRVDIHCEDQVRKKFIFGWDTSSSIAEGLADKGVKGLCLILTMLQIGTYNKLKRKETELTQKDKKSQGKTKALIWFQFEPQSDFHLINIY